MLSIDRYRALVQEFFVSFGHKESCYVFSWVGGVCSDRDALYTDFGNAIVHQAASLIQSSGGLVKPLDHDDYL